MNYLNTKETILEDAVQQALPRSKNAEFEIHYDEFISCISEAPIEQRLEIIQDILGDTTKMHLSIRNIASLVNAVLATLHSTKKHKLASLISTKFANLFCTR